MADRYLLESADGLLLESGESILLDGPYAVAVLAMSGLVGYWRLDEASGATATAQVGPDGTYGGTPVYAQTTLLSDGSGTSVNFNSASWVGVGDQTWFDGTNKWTFAAWVSHTPDATFRRIFGKEDPAHGSGRQGTELFSQSGSIKIERWLNGTGVNAAGTTLAAGTHFIVATYDTADKLNLYIDGTLAGSSAATTSSMIDLPNPFDIGRQSSGGNGFNGIIDEPAVWNRALTGAEVTTLWTAGVSGGLTNAAAGLASGTGTANNSAASVLPTAGQAAGTGAAGASAASVKPNAGAATATGTALAPTLTLTSNASPGVATGTGAGANVAAKVAPNAGTGTGTGLANNAVAATAKSVAATVATGTGAASNVAATVAATAGTGTGTGAASGAMGSDQASAIIATGTGAAHSATVTAFAFKDADAGTATGTGSALDPAPSIKVNAGVASGTGVASDPFALIPGVVAASAGTATGTGTAHNATASAGVVVVPPAPVRRPLPTRRRRDSNAVSADSAMASATAHGATIRTITKSETASGTGSAHNASITWNDDETAMLVLLGDLELAA